MIAPKHRLGLILITSMLLIGMPTLAMTDSNNIVPLIRSKPAPRSLDLTIGLSYFPVGDEGFTIEPTGAGVFMYKEWQQYLYLPMHLRYNAAETFSLSASIGYGINHKQTHIRSHIGEEISSSITSTNDRKTIGLGYSFLRGHPWEPEIAVSVDIPVQAMNVGLSGTWIGDPLVLSASLENRILLETKESRWALDLGVGFYVNERIRLRASTRYDIPVGHVAVPEWSASFGMVYALDHYANNDVSVDMVTTRSGSEQMVGLQLTWHKRFQFKR